MSNKSQISTSQILCRNIKGEEFIVPKESLIFRPSVYAVIINDGKILLSKQWDGYDFPGGGIEKGETIADALKREVKEETGLEAKIGRIITAENSFFRSSYSTNCFQSVLLYYLAEVTGGELSTEFFDQHEREYASLAEWFDLGKIETIKFYNSIDSLAVIKKAKELL